MAKKSIVFILPDLNKGGAEKITTLLANELIKKNEFDVYLILMRKEGLLLEELSNKVEIIDLKVKRIRQSIFKILFIIFKFKFNLVFSGYGEVNAFLSPFIPFFRKTKFIARETNVVSQHVTRKEILFLYKFYNNFDVIIAQSDDMKLDLITNFKIKEPKIVKINNPIDLDYVNQKLALNQEVLFNKNVKNIVAVGSLSHRKGFDNLLKVFSFLKKETIHLHILGDGAEKETLLAQKETLGLENVHFLGLKTNPYPFMQQADLFVLSSRYEGFPNVLLEANACGTYALANNCKGGINEIILEKENGEIFSIENHKEFAEKIKRILSTKKDKLSIKETVKNRYDKEIIMENYFNVLKNI